MIIEGGVTYIQTWNFDNNLEQVTWNGENVRFIYDGDGNRLLKIEQPSGSPQKTTLYLGQHYEVAVGSAITPTKYYFHGVTRVAMWGGGEVYYLHGDHLGSTSLTTDQNGDIFSAKRHLPYGEENWANGVAPTDFGFTAQRNEASFGLMDYKARYYSPYLGRFISPDPIVPEPTSSSGFNRFAYVYNNPLRYTDPTGYFTEDEIKESLRKFYQDKEYDNVDELVEHTWEMWQEDPNFLRALGEGQIGGNVWASHMRIDGEFVPGHGVFSLGEDGRIMIDWHFGDRPKSQLDLYQLQGQGAYQISNGAGEIWSSCNSGSCFRFQENYNYLGGVPITSAGTTSILWEETLLGLNPTWGLVTDRREPYWPSTGDAVFDVFGVVVPAISVRQALLSTGLYEPGVWISHRPDPLGPGAMYERN